MGALASIPDSEKPEAYKAANLALEGTSYEYPQRRLTTTDLKARYKIRGKTRVEALPPDDQEVILHHRSSGFYMSLHLFTVVEWAFGSSVTEYNNPDDGQNWSVPDGARNFLYLDGHVENK